MKKDTLWKDYMRYAGEKKQCPNFKSIIEKLKMLAMLF